MKSIIILFSLFFITLSPLLAYSDNTKEKANENILSNPSFEKVENIGATHYTYLCDKYGNRAFPWGFEIWEGRPVCLFDNMVSRTGNYSAKIEGFDIDDVAVVAIPNPQYKPKVKGNTTYEWKVWVKFEDVKGQGVRLALQFFDQKSKIIKKTFGDFYKGTAEWQIIILKDVVPEDAIKGDPIVELIGPGKIWMDDVEFTPISP